MFQQAMQILQNLSKIKEVIGVRKVKAKDMISQLVNDNEVMTRLARELLFETEEGADD